MSIEEAPDSAVHPFSPRLFLSEGWELFLRALPALVAIWVVSASLQAASGLAMPSGDKDPQGALLMLASLAKALEAVALYAVLSSRHPGADWSLRQLQPVAAFHTCLLLMAVLATVLLLAPLLSVLIFPVALVAFSLASLAPVYVLCDGLMPLAAMRAAFKLVQPHLARFLPFACVLLAVEQLGAMGAETAFASLAAEGALGAALVAACEALVSSLVAAVFVATLFRLRGPRRTGLGRV